MIKIGFVFLDGIYLIPHFFDSVAELYNRPNIKVDILTHENPDQYLYQALDKYNIPYSIIKQLPTYLYKKIAYKIQGRKKPSNQYIIKKNKKILLNYDILVFTVFNNKRIKRKNKNKPKYIFLMHGAGDSFFPFQPEHKSTIEEFSLVTTPGKKINDLFAQMGKFKNTHFEICGYQKLDFVKKMKTETVLFNDDKPVVLYNPHFSKQFSSFYRYGLDILEYFYQNKEYNFIFAPHMNLFSEESKNSLSINLIPKKYYETEHMIIDFGSIQSVNMTYTQNADIYIGDVSSQIYEFLIEKTKPAIFIDIQQINQKENLFFKHFSLGKVITDIKDLPELLQTRELWQKKYEKKQKKMIEYTFDIDPNKSSGKRVAETIINFIEKDK